MATLGSTEAWPLVRRDLFMSTFYLRDKVGTTLAVLGMYVFCVFLQILILCRLETFHAQYAFMSSLVLPCRRLRSHQAQIPSSFKHSYHGHA
jgi:hypothetical protein